MKKKLIWWLDQLIDEYENVIASCSDNESYLTDDDIETHLEDKKKLKELKKIREWVEYIPFQK